MNDSTHSQEAFRPDPSVTTNPYAAASAGALADLQAPVAETPAEEAKPAEATETADPVVTEESAKPAEQAAPDTSNDLRFELKVKGQTQVLSRDELIEMAQKGVDYTQKTQKVAESERQVLAAAELLQQREREIAEFLRDPDRVRAWTAQLQQEAVATNADPNDIPTQASVIAQLRAQQREMQAQMDGKVQEVEQRINQRLFEADVAEKRQDYEGQLSKTIGGLVEKFPALDAYDSKDLDKILRSDIAEKVAAKIAQFPDTAVSMDEVKAMLVDAAKSRSDRAQARIDNHVKMSAVRAAKLTRSGIEPAGGAVADPIPAVPAKSPKLGSRELLDSVTADINALFKKG